MGNLNSNNFLEKFREIHGDKFNYKESIYVNTTTKINIRCDIHGIFKQAPKQHYLGQGCSKCHKDSLKLTREEFVKKSNIKHGDKYDYSDSIYINSRTKLNIICKIHGEFEMQPNNHLNGQGCNICAGVKQIDTNKFISNSIKIHNNQYFYGKSIYVNSNSKIIITCKKHGDFSQRAGSHLSGNGCPKCYKNTLKTNMDYIEDINKKHNYIYDYSKVDYKGSLSKVLIICKIHGEFNQLAQAHLSGSGCPKCKRSKGENLIEAFLVAKNINYIQQYTFSDLKFKKLLQYDFGILDNFGNLLFLIEYNGEQHYKYNKFMFKTLDNFNIAQNRFQMKVEYSVKNNIPLYIIKYDQDINTILNTIFNI